MRRLLQLCALSFVVLWATRAAASPTLSPEMGQVDVVEQRGTALDRQLAFKDHTGAAVTIDDLLKGGKPLVLTLNYFRCAVICSVQLDGLRQALEKLDWAPGGENFRLATVSIDPRETPEDAAKKRKRLLHELGKGEVDWNFLTTDALTIKALAAQLGIGFAYDPDRDQYAHPAVTVFIAPDGKVTQYIYGLTYNPRDIKFSVIEASEGKLGSPMEKLIMSCFYYDAEIGRYGAWAFGIMRLGGAIVVLLLGTFLLLLWRRDRHRVAPHVETTT